MGRLKPNLLVVAHPDDETIFFAGLILQENKRPWHVVCVTDGGADGRGPERRAELKKACELLQVQHVEVWDFKDQFEVRLNNLQLEAKLRESEAPAAVFTHGILGEYGHPHHQDVCRAVHQVFTSHRKIPVWSVAYNCNPEKIVRLTKATYAIKTKILTDVYRHETKRFLNLLPALGVEGFVQLFPQDVENLYQFMISGSQAKDLPQLEGPHLKWITPHLKDTPYVGLKRPF